MHITKLRIEGFKVFDQFELQLDSGLNIIVGDNETGKTTLLEAINLVLSGQLDGRNIQNELSPYVFNSKLVDRYCQNLQNGLNAVPPRILIEAYFKDDSSGAFARIKGTNNTANDNCPGVCLTVELHQDFAEDLKKYMRDNPLLKMIPTEYYTVAWRSFAGNSVTNRTLPFRSTVIDTSLVKSYSGPNRYVTRIIGDALDENQRRSLSMAYRKLKQTFMGEPAINQINSHLATKKGDVTAKTLTVSMDMSARSTWESGVAAHLDDIPFDSVGKGEQCRVQMKLAIEAAGDSNVLLIEEPENHLSHCNMSRLIDDISQKQSDKQVVITTHSSFVLNKLGIDKIKLLSERGDTMSLADLSPATRAYFMKLPGYNTLRLILAKKSILVEGPSDELIVQKAYLVSRGKMPLADGVDVIAVGSLAFKRFLEIGKLLKLELRVVIDNDGKVADLENAYEEYMQEDSGAIRICYDKDDSYPSLEPQLLKANSLEVLNTVLARNFDTTDELLNYMRKHKTDCALRIFECTDQIAFPQYIGHAIEL